MIPPGTLGRRRFLCLAAADAAAPALLSAAAAAFKVGAGSSSDPYTATRRAVAACGQWPASAIAGQTVIIKPNLVQELPASSGVTTDPQVVRAVVDLALASGASSVLIVETPLNGRGTYWTTCGYDIFNNYDPRVQLVDLRNGGYTLAPVPNGYAYNRIWLPSVLFQPGSVLISAGKLKTHGASGATLSMKNLFGLIPQSPYEVPNILARGDMHYRGVDPSIVDLSLARPIDFAVIDGVWGMQGEGPAKGIPIAMNLVLAGANALAVDRVALSAMQFSQTAAPHLGYATAKGLGPADLSGVQVLGDSFSPAPFLPATTPPAIWRPVALPGSFSLSTAGQVSFSYRVGAPCETKVEIIQDDDRRPGFSTVRTIHDWAPLAAASETAVWRGGNDSGALVAPGLYLARVAARFSASSTTVNRAVAMISVLA